MTDREMEVRKVLSILESQLIGDGFMLEFINLDNDDVKLRLNQISHCCPVDINRMIEYVKKIMKMEIEWVKEVEVVL